MRVKAVIQESADAYHASDYDRVAAVWLNDETAVRMNARPGRSTYRQGWEALDARYKTFFKDNPEPSGNKEVNSDFKIKVYGESARAIYNVKVQNSEGEFYRSALHTAFLEKKNGTWKIAYLSSVWTSSYDMIEKNIEASVNYHNLKAGDVDNILTDDFIGRHENRNNTWDKETHREFLSTNESLQDSIYVQFGRTFGVATLFKRKMKLDGKEVEANAMQVKRIENGKILEVWEFFEDFKQIE